MLISRVLEGEPRTKAIIGYCNETNGESRYKGFSISIKNYLLIRITYVFGYINPGCKRLGLSLFNNKIC